MDYGANDGWVLDADEVAEREAAREEQLYTWGLLTSLQGIASTLVPCPSESNKSAQLWRTLIAYMNEFAIGEELSECMVRAHAPVSGYRVRPKTKEDARMGALREWLSQGEVA